MDSSLLAVLQCPRCAGALNAAGKALECRTCQVDFPDLGGVPCLMPEPQRAVNDWRRESQRFLELIDKQVETFDRELARADLLASTRRRLVKLRDAYRDNGATIIGMFRDAGLGPDSRAKASGRDHSLIMYYEQALRDWGWDAEGGVENQQAADLIAESLGDAQQLGRVLVLGAGPSRLAYDLHQRFAPRLTVCVDLDPLLLLIANRVLFGGGVNLTEFPSDPPSIDGACVSHQLAAPAGTPARFALLLGDAFAAPLRPGSFDTVVTPWFIDIVPTDVRETISVIHRLLAPGGRWLNYGPLSYPQEHRHGQRYCPDEVVELIRAGGFELPGLSRTTIDYMRSRGNGRWKKVEVLTFAAAKLAPAAAGAALAPGDAPAWLMFAHLPIPRFPGLSGYTPDHPMLGYLAQLIDGQRTMSDLAAKVVADHGAKPEAALEGTRAMLGLLHKAVQEKKPAEV